MPLTKTYLAWVAVEYGQAEWNTIKGWYSGLAPHMCISMSYSGVIWFSVRLNDTGNNIFSNL